MTKSDEGKSTMPGRRTICGECWLATGSPRCQCPPAPEPPTQQAKNMRALQLLSSLDL